MDYCATCFQPLRPAPLAGTYRCCQNRYITRLHVPHERDEWYPHVQAIFVNGFVRRNRHGRAVRSVIPTGHYHVYEAPTIRITGGRAR